MQPLTLKPWPHVAGREQGTVIQCAACREWMPPPMINLTGCLAGLSLRRARWSDLFRLYRWRNHPTVYRYFRSAQPITWREHLRWFWQIRHSEDDLLYLGVVQGQPVGVVRLEQYQSFVELSLTIDPSVQHHGYGTGILHWIQKEQLARLKAVVHEDNTHSLALFAKAGFCSAVKQSPWVILWHDQRPNASY